MGVYTRNLKRVRKNFVAANLVDVCERSIMDFDSFGEVVWVDDHSGEFYVYQDNGANVLGVAHLDTVQAVNDCTVTTTKSGAPIVFSPALDDRLGAWVIVDLLPRLDVKIDWLLTTGEEMGLSTGADFVSHHLARNGKKYNWMFQFDRTGTDVVMYDYECSDLAALLKSVGMVRGNGSFSDISMMENLGCKGFNVGVGYEDYHSKRAHAWLDDTFSQVARFMDFYRRYAERAMPHERLLPVWEWRTWTGKDGAVHNYQARVIRTASEVAAALEREEEEDERELTGTEFGERPWSIVRDEFLSAHGSSTRYISSHDVHQATNATRRPLADEHGPYAHQRDCLCGHAEYLHKQAADRRCDYDGCDCTQFNDAEAALAFLGGM